MTRSPLTVPATLASIATIGDYLATAASEAGLTERAAYRLRLAVDELATNVIVHGYGENGVSGDVTIRADVSPGAVTVTIEDGAPAFDPRSRPLPDERDLAQSLDRREAGGLGVFLAIKSVEDLRYERRGNRNITIVEVRQRPGEASAS